MSSSLLFAELTATCNALGYSDGKKYYIDTHCQETIKDLIRYLRRDDENHEIRRYLGEAKVLQADLLPMLKDYWEKTELFDVILRLLVNLTNPALLLYREELPAEKTSRNYYLQIISHLQSNKEAFCDDGIWKIFSKKLEEILQIDSLEREEDKGLVIERILILVRNVLQVPSDPEAEKRTDNDATVHDKLLMAIQQSSMIDLFLYISCSENEQQYYMHILEIVSLMLREQNPAQLADAGSSRSMQEKERDEMELLSIRQNEIQQRQAKSKKFAGARHSRFGGTYVLQDIKSISDNALIYHKPLNKLDSLDFDLEKTRQRRPRNRLPMKGGGVERRSSFSVRVFLKQFCIEFLHGAYNTLMYHVKDNLVRAKAQANDESYYLWAMKFFMEFNRNYLFDIKFVSETMSVQAFHFVQTQLENFYDNMATDKKKILLWSRRMHLGLKAYQELLMTLIAMDKCDNSVVQESSKVIKSNIFYVVEYRELILTLLVNFDDIKFTKAYLKDLVETTHVFLKLLEQFCKNRSVVVQKRSVSRKHKSKKSKQPAQEAASNNNPEDLWDEVGPQLSTVLQTEANIPTDVIPFDATSDRNMDEQKVDAMCKIQTLLRDHQFEEAVGQLRASREVWPENDSFGSSTMAPEEEFMALRDIFMADIQNPNIEVQPAPVEEENSEEEEDEEEQQVADISVREQDFQFTDFANRFVHHKVVQAYSLLLKQFEKNLAYTNHCIVKMLHRITWDCKLPAILFQASLFRTFQKIMDSKQSHHKELAKFATFVISKFAEVAKNNPKVYMELLFWKTSRDAFDIEQGYGSYQEKTHSSKQVWSEEEEEELRRLYQEFMNRPEGGENTGDVVEWVMQNLINDSRSQRGVAKKLRELGYDIKTKSSRRPGNTRPPKEWSEQEVLQLRELFEEFREAMDPLGCIIDRLDVKRPKKRIVDKLLEMGVVQDRKELRKKRARKSKLPDASGWESEGIEDLESDESSDSGSDDSDGDGRVTKKAPTARVTQPQQKPQGSKKTVKNIKNKKSISKPFSSAELVKTLTDVMSAGMTEALNWISSSMEEVADDRETEDDEEEGVPILPLSEEAMTAMDNELFLKLLSALGIVPPADEQESYWRIPGNLKSPDLRKRIEVISQVLDGRLTANDEEPVENTEDIDAGPSTSSGIHTEVDEETTSTQKEKRKHNEKNRKKENHARKPIRNIMMDSDSETEQDSLRPSVAQEEPSQHDSNARGISRNTLNSESESEEISLSLLANTSQHTAAKKNKLRNLMMDSDSETETQEENVTSSNTKTSGKKNRNVLMDSDSESKSQVSRNKTKKTLIDSDSEGETLLSTANSIVPDSKKRHLEENNDVGKQKKRFRIVSYDDEEDD